MPAQAPPSSLVSMTSEGGPARSALEVMKRHGPDVSNSLRRAVPFFARRGVRAVCGEPTLIGTSDLLDSVKQPAHVAHMAAEPGGTRAFLAIDSAAIAFLLEGSLGGDGKNIVELETSKLTAAQQAFMTRIVGSIVAVVSETLHKVIGLRLRSLPAPAGEKCVGGTLVAVPLTLEEDGEEDGADPVPRGLFTLAISKHALHSVRSKSTSGRRRRIDPRVIKVLEETELEMIAELGQLSMSLDQLSNLEVGDTLRLDSQVDALVDVVIDGHVMFRGQPTPVGTQLAIRIVERVGADQPPQVPKHA